MSYQLIQANANNLPLEDETVDLIITSPPYFALRSYRDDGEHYDGQIGSEDTPTQFLNNLIECTKEMKRVLKPTGSMFINLGDKYAGSGGHNNANINTSAKSRASSTLAGKQFSHIAGEENITPPATRRNAPDSYNQTSDGVPRKSLMGLPWRYTLRCIDELNLILRQEIIWHKPNGLPESVTDRTRRNHEQWFHLVKNPTYYTSIDHIREPLVGPPHGPGDVKPVGTDEDLRNDSDRNNRIFGNTALGRLPGSVWTIPTEPLTGIPPHLPQHYAAFPQEWPRRLILGFSPTGICTICHKGRTPTNSGPRWPGDNNPLRYNDPNNAGHKVAHMAVKGEGNPLTITGEACGCGWDQIKTLPPTTPAVVLDPFAGTGTTIGVAHTLGRHGIGTDLSHDYLQLAQWRIQESGHFEKTYQRTAKEGTKLPLTPPPTTLTGQETLL